MKKILPTLLISAFILGGAVVANAAEKDASSTAKIGLQTSDDNNDPSTPIVDPDDNDGPTNDPTGDTGNLRIDYVSNIDFHLRLKSI